jgi:hypothetical protein
MAPGKVKAFAFERTIGTHSDVSSSESDRQSLGKSLALNYSWELGWRLVSVHG